MIWGVHHILGTMQPPSSPAIPSLPPEPVLLCLTLMTYCYAVPHPRTVPPCCTSCRCLQEGATRRMLQHCGLPMHPAMLKLNDTAAADSGNTSQLLPVRAWARVCWFRVLLCFLTAPCPPLHRHPR
jgi:hypothetical protein